MMISEQAKVELHQHLEGAAPPDFIRQSAHEKKLTWPVFLALTVANCLTILGSF